MDRSNAGGVWCGIVVGSVRQRTANRAVAFEEVVGPMRRDALDHVAHDSIVPSDERCTAPALQDMSDLDLLAKVRDGDDSAFGELYNRHAEVVRAFAIRNYGATADADDLTAEAFFRVLQAVRRRSAHIRHMRAYLLTVTRRVAWEWSVRRRDVPVDDEELTRRSETDVHRTLNADERSLITRAFTSLPERWRNVLWRVEVEGERPAVIAGQYGLSANATAALARRARDGLRAAYLQAHLAKAEGPVNCRSVVQKLGVFTAGGVRGAEQRRIAEHLHDCAACSDLQSELAQVCSGLRVHASALIGPAVGLGTAFGGAQWSVTGVASSLGKAVFVGSRMKLVVAASAAAGVGVFAVSVGSWLGPDERVNAAPEYDSARGDQKLQVCTECVPHTSGVAALPPRDSTPHSTVGSSAAANIGAAESIAGLPNRPGRGAVAGPGPYWLAFAARPSVPGRHAKPAEADVEAKRSVSRSDDGRSGAAVDQTNAPHEQSHVEGSESGAAQSSTSTEFAPQSASAGWDDSRLSQNPTDESRPRPSHESGTSTSDSATPPTSGSSYSRDSSELEQDSQANPDSTASSGSSQGESVSSQPQQSAQSSAAR